MVATRDSSLTLIDGSNTYTLPFFMKNGARELSINPHSWQMSRPEYANSPALRPTPFRHRLFPVHGGLATDKQDNPSGYAKGNADTSHLNLVVPPPLHTAVTLTNSVTPSQIVEFDGLLFFLGGRYMYYINPSTHAAVEDKDFGASKAAVSMAVFNKELIVAMGETEKIWKRSIGVNTSGTANAAVTSTNTTLADTRLSLTVNAYVGATVTCNGKTMVVTSNTATEFTGASWSGGGNPGNGNAWSVAGTWTQASDDTFAIALGVVDSKLWRAETTNQISNCLTTPLTLTNWSPASGSEYTVGDTTYAVNTIIDYQGGVWIGCTDGMYAADPTYVFHNQTPQLMRWPHTDNCKGAFVAHGSLWVPSAAGLLRIKVGLSIPQGPEIVGRPNYRYWVRGGVEFGGNIYLLCTDQSSASAENTAIIKMVRNPNDPNVYTYHEWCTLGATTKGYCITATTKSTVPELYLGFGNNAKYVPLGLSGGRDIDDTLHNFGLASVLEFGRKQLGPDYGITAIVQGVEVVSKLRTGDSLTVSLKMDGGSYVDLLSDQDGSTTSAITGPTTDYDSNIRYAVTTSVGQFAEVKLTGVHAAGNGTDRTEIIDAFIFGQLRPKVTDVIVCGLVCDGVTINGHGVSSGVSAMDLHRIFSGWYNDSTVLIMQLGDYQDNKTVRVMVADVQLEEMELDVGEGISGSAFSKLTVTFVRTLYGPDYGAA